MKNVLSKLIFLSSTMMLICFNLKAAPVLTIDSITAQKNKAAISNISISNTTESYAGINAKLFFPKGVYITDVFKGPLLTDDFVIKWQVSFSSGKHCLVFILFSENTTFNTDGTLLKVKLSITENAEFGAHHIYFARTDATESIVNSNHAVSNFDGSKSITHKTADAYITILGSENPDVGDFDQDGKITLNDLILVLKIVSQINALANIKADINNNGRIGLEEAIYVFQTISRNQ